MNQNQVWSIRSQISELQLAQDKLRRAYVDIQGMKLYRRQGTKEISQDILDNLSADCESLWYQMRELNELLPLEYKATLYRKHRKIFWRQ